MYITVSSIKKTLGKYIEMNDLYIGLPMLFSFLLIFSFIFNYLLLIEFAFIHTSFLLYIDYSRYRQ